MNQRIKNPDCRDGKHGICDGHGWDIDADTAVRCPCDCHVTHAPGKVQTAPDVRAWCTCGESFDAYGDKGALNKLADHLQHAVPAARHHTVQHIRLDDYYTTEGMLHIATCTQCQAVAGPHIVHMAQGIARMVREGHDG